MAVDTANRWNPPRHRLHWSRGQSISPITHPPSTFFRRTRRPWPTTHDVVSCRTRFWRPPRGGRTGERGFCQEKQKTRTKTVCPSDKLGVVVIGVHGRGQTHIDAFLDRADTEILCICDADEAVGQERVEQIASETGPQAQVRPRHARGVRRQVDRHRLDRHAEPLARPGGDLGDAGRQGRLRREAGQPQRQRRPADGRGRAEVREDLPDRHAVPLDGRHDRGDRVRPRRQDRRGEARPRPVLQAAQADRQAGRVRAAEDASTTISGVGPAPMAPAHAAAVPLRLALAIALRQRRPRQPGHPPDGPRPMGTRSSIG